MDIELEERLTKIVRLIVDAPDAAKHGLIVTTTAAKISLSDIHVVVAAGERTSAMFTLARENRELRDELRRVRGARGLAWEDFLAACSEHVDTTQPTWRSMLVSHLNLSLADLAAFERNNRVPMAVLKLLESVPDLRDVRAKSNRRKHNDYLSVIIRQLRSTGMRKVQVRRLVQSLLTSYDGDEESLVQAIEQELSDTPQRKRSGAYAWTAEEYALGLQLLCDGKGLPAVCAALPRATEGQINRKFNNDGPDEALLGPIPIAESGPMTFLELWKIAQDLYGETWKNDVISRYGQSRTAIRWNEPTFLTDAQCDELRYEWRERFGWRRQYHFEQ